MKIKRLWVLPAMAILLGCGGHDRAVLLPDRQGHPGALLVQTDQGETLLDRPYEAAEIRADGRVEKQLMDAAAVQRQFEGALSAQPPRPVSYTLYFIADRNELTPESKPIMDQIRMELSRRPFPEIVVIGHTDSVGAAAYNDALSLKRAETMRQMLIEAGISPNLIAVAGRGSREMIVKTEDGVPEPRNRRVEISVR
ncbi:MAG: OmpA family protein [Deltaproteobacteria bacterium]|nr:OmpA family protein [Deltaproteobacteria bacterium]